MEARAPDRFTQDFLQTKLGVSGGSATPIIPLLKRMKFLESDGTPTDRYHRFRNESTSGLAVAEGMKDAFEEIFQRNEYANDLSKEKLTSLIVEITGSAKDDRVTKAVAGTFSALNELADFDALSARSGEELKADAEVEVPPSQYTVSNSENSTNFLPKGMAKSELRVAYTINLNLPETSDPAVFNAIFKALRENLMAGE